MSRVQAMHIVARGNVFLGEASSPEQSSAFPGICVLPGGRWICTFRAAPQKLPTAGQHVLLTWSDDQGATWSEPIVPFDPPVVSGKPGLFRSAYLTALSENCCVAALCWVDHSDPELDFFNEETQGLLDTRIFLSRSEDGGQTWSKPERMETAPFHLPTPLTGPILRLPNGDWACQFELNKHYDDPEVWRHSSVLMFSKDEGKSWPEHVITSNDPTNRLFYWDQRPGATASASIMNLYWTYDNEQGDYLNIHARRSTDYGRTWSDFWNTCLPGQPAQPVQLSDGKWVIIYVDRTSSPMIKARISEDGGLSWPDASEVILYEPVLQGQNKEKASMQDAWSEMGKFSVGLPATARLADESIVVVYYAGAHSDHTGIEWVHLK